MKSTRSLFSSLVLSFAFLALAIFALPSFAQAATPATGNADENTVTAVTALVAPGTTAADLIAKGFRPDSVLKAADGSVTQVYKNVRFVINPVTDLTVRVQGSFGAELSVKLVADKVVSWQFSG